MARDLTIRQAQRVVAEYLKAKGARWTRLRDHYFLVTHLVEEMGELARGVINLEAKIVEPRRRGLALPRKERLALVRDSLGDLLYHLLKLAVAYDIDLQSAFLGSMGSITSRYPVAER